MILRHDNGLTTIDFDYDVADDLSNRLFETIAENDPPVGDAAVACGLTIARLMTPERLSTEDEVRFIEAIIEWAGAYFGSQGGIN